MKLEIFLIFISVCVSCYILYLVKRNLIYLPYTLFWLTVSLIVLILGIFPSINIRIASFLGIEYYPILPVLGAILLLFIKNLYQDIELSKKEQKIRRLIQEIGILKERFERHISEEIDHAQKG